MEWNIGKCETGILECGKMEYWKVGIVGVKYERWNPLAPVTK